MGIFQDIPNDVLADEKRKIDADNWAAVQRRQLADEWAAEQRRQLAEMMQQYQPRGGMEIGASGTIGGQTIPSTVDQGQMRDSPRNPLDISVDEGLGRMWSRDPGEAIGRLSADIRDPALETAVYLGSRGVEGTSPVEGAEALREGWRTRGEPFPGVKGAIELSTDPLNLLPVGAAGRATRQAFQMGKPVGEAVKAGLKAPELARMVPAASVEDVGRGVSGAVPPSGGLPERAGLLPTVPSNEEVLQSAYNPDVFRRIADRLGDNRVATSLAQITGMPKRDVFTQGMVLRESLLGNWRSGVVGAMSKVRQLGSSNSLFAVDKDGMAVIGGRKIPVNDVLEYPDRYGLTDTQKTYARTIHQAYDDTKAKLLSEGIDTRELTFEEGGHYVGRRVMGRMGKDGEMELANIRTGGRAKVGGKAAFDKSRTFETQQEAIDAGFRYMTPEEALNANLNAAGKKIADKRLTDYILERIPYRKASAPEEIKLAVEHARGKLGAVGTLKAVINRGYRGERVPPATIKAIGKYFPEQAQTLLEAQITKIESSAVAPIERSLLQKVEAQLPSIKDQSSAQFYRARDAMSTAMERARSPRFGEGTVQTPAFQGKFFSEKDAQQLRRILDLEQQSPIRGAARAISWVNALPRLLMTTVDLGAGLIQGQVSLFSHPIVATKAFGRSLEALASEKNYQSFLATHGETLKKWSRYGAEFSPSEFSSAIQPGGLASKIPVVRDVVRPFTRSFEALLNAGRVYGLEATEKLAKTPQDHADLAKFWNEMTGVVDTARMGISPTQREVETAMMFAPRYKRAGYALLTDIGKGGLRGTMARDAIAKYLLVGMTTYVGTAKMLGQEPILDPRDRKFLTVEVLGQDVGLGGTYYSLSRALSRMVLEPQKIAEIATSYASSLLSPVVSTARELGLPRITSEGVKAPYVYSNPKEVVPRLTEAVVGENAVPIWLQAVAYDEHTNTGAALTAGAMEFLGGRTVAPKKEVKGKKGSPVEMYLSNATGGAVGKYLQSIGGR